MYVYKLVDNDSGFSAQEADVYTGSLNGAEDQSFVITNKEVHNREFGNVYYVYKVTSTVLSSSRYDISIPVDGVLDVLDCKIWIKNNKIHRDDGPAYLYKGEKLYYFLNGIAMSFEQFVERQKNTEHYNKIFANTFGDTNE